jgi:hypothetical protein
MSPVQLHDISRRHRAAMAMFLMKVFNSVYDDFPTRFRYYLDAVVK